MKNAKPKETRNQLASIQRKISEIADSEETVWERQRSIFE